MSPDDFIQTGRAKFYVNVVDPFLVLAIFGACANSASGGPLDQSSDQGALCTPVAISGSITVGIETLFNSANEPAVIESVILVEPTGLSIIEARVVPIQRLADGSRHLIGVVSEYPPEELDEWLRSEPAEGFEVTPGRGDRRPFQSRRWSTNGSGR